MRFALMKSIDWRIYLDSMKVHPGCRFPRELTNIVYRKCLMTQQNLMEIFQQSHNLMELLRQKLFIPLLVIFTRKILKILTYLLEFKITFKVFNSPQVFLQWYILSKTLITYTYFIISLPCLVFKTISTKRYFGPSGVRALPLAAGINEGGHYYRYWSERRCADGVWQP